MSLTKKQLETRKKGISATDVAAILGLNPYRRPINVWLDKTQPVQDEEPNQRLELGHVFEKHIADYYAHRHAPDGKWRRLYAPKTTLVHPNIEWVLATPDRFVFEIPIPDGDGHLPRGLKQLATDGKASHLAEIKLVGPYTVKDWISDREVEMDEADRIPMYVFCQCQWQLLVTGYQRVDVPALLGGTHFSVFEIARDQKFIDDAMTICSDFRKKYILTGAEPPPDGSAKYTDYMRNKYPGQANAKMLPAPEFVEEMVREYQALGSQIKECKSKQDELSQMIKTAIGDSDGIEGDWGKATWRLGNGRVDFKKLVSDLGISQATLDKYRKPGRTFRTTLRANK
jgi:putative phage-type endonuclease